MWRDLIWGKRLTLAQHGKMDVFKINDDDDDTIQHCRTDSCRPCNENLHKTEDSSGGT